MIVTKEALPRRTFLRGVGATFALPLLDAMVPSMTALAATPANREDAQTVGCHDVDEEIRKWRLREVDHSLKDTRGPGRYPGACVAAVGRCGGGKVLA